MIGHDPKIMAVDRLPYFRNWGFSGGVAVAVGLVPLPYRKSVSLSRTTGAKVGTSKKVLGQSHIKILLDDSVNSGHRIRSFVHDFTHSLERQPPNCWTNHTKQRTDYAITVSIAFTRDCPQKSIDIYLQKV